jgi:predicted CxxxxCH...CXXCH cytochrome family protein
MIKSVFISNLLKYCMVLLIFVTLWGCGKGNPNSPVGIDPTTGKHAVGWFDVGTGGNHPSAYFADAASCAECHGQDLKGGVTKVSCSPGPNNTGCHQKFPHNDGFNSPVAHGPSAKGPATATGIFGMAHCTHCHGLDYQGGVGPSCIKCHQTNGSNPATQAPHGANWKVFGRHSKSDESNAAACFKCHAGGKYSHPAPTPASPKTDPGCFNGTLCHNSALPHAVPFINATSHGKAIKKTFDWLYCGNCHKAADSTSGYPRYNVSIGNMTTGCESCHKKPYIAHPQMWLPGRGDGTPTTIGGTDAVRNTSHIDVPAGNIITSCTLCHGIIVPSANPAVPSCATGSINGIKCHFLAPVNSVGQSNGCKSCHNFTFTSTSADFSNFTTGKHTKHVNSISVNWPGLTPACTACHVTDPNNFGRGAKHANGTKDVVILGQFGTSAAYDSNNKTCSGVSCHGSSTTPAWTAPIAGCTTCHGTPPNTGAHVKHFTNPNVTCNSCHNGAGYGTPLHINGIADVLFLTSQVGAAASYTGTVTKGCNNTYCHGATLTGGGTNKNPTWFMTGLGCATCHGFPPTSAEGGTKTHPASANCNACHSHVNSTNNGFTNVALHIDGIVEFTAAPHPVPSYPGSVHKNAADFSICSGCHDLNATAAGVSPPNCRSCHKVASPITALGVVIGGCVSCHPNPPASNAHTLHLSFPGGGGVTCSACHNGAGSGTTLHDNTNRTTATVSISSTFLAETGGAATYDTTAKTCANISCHGGTHLDIFNPPSTTNLTPVWTTTGNNLTGTCENCHTANLSAVTGPTPYTLSPVTPQYNSPWSGDGRATGHNYSLHASHTGVAPNGDNFGNLTCDNCHDATKLAVNHFRYLNTPGMEGPASATIGGVATSVFGYTPSTGTCSTAGCHSTKNWK